MPSTITHDRITRYLGTPVVSQAYYTWLPGRDGEVVTVAEVTPSRVIVDVQGLNYPFAPIARRTFRLGVRRQWAELNPVPMPLRTYLTVAPADTADNYCDSPAWRLCQWGEGSSLLPEHHRGHYVARNEAGVSQYVRCFVALDPVALNPDHVELVRDISANAPVRLTHTTQVHRIGTLTTAAHAYRQDHGARGVQTDLHPDPGHGPYVPWTPVPAHHIRLAEEMQGGSTTVRVISSTNRSIIGQILTATAAAQAHYDTRGVILNSAYPPDTAHIHPDPGAGPYEIDNTPPPLRFTHGDCVVYVGSDSYTQWTNPTFGTVTGLEPGSRRQIQVRADSDQGVGSTYQWVRETDLQDEAEWMEGREACDECGNIRCLCVECGRCEETGLRADMVHTSSYVPIWYHADCAVNCPGCSQWVSPEDMQEVDFEQNEQGDPREYCGACIQSCDNCGEYTMGPGMETCPDCERRRNSGVRGYGHTHPTMWLGGPLPKDEKGHNLGFYVGFELEVSSSDYDDVSDLQQWAETHMGNSKALDPKEDGSVSGFEIATQPMTPEFFESINWESFFDMLEEHATWDTSASREPSSHGLHVHIGRIAFERDDVATAMFTYLLGQDSGAHLERIGRREPTGYCAKVRKPVSTALVQRWNRTGRGGKQAVRLQQAGGLAGRDAINLSNESTIEIRAFRSTRDADHLRAAVRVVYLAARYIAHLRGAQIDGQHGRTSGGFVSPKALHWDQFMTWVQGVMPEAVDALRAPKPEPAVQPEAPAQSIGYEIHGGLTGQDTITHGSRGTVRLSEWASVGAIGLGELVSPGEDGEEEPSSASFNAWF